MAAYLICRSAACSHTRAVISIQFAAEVQGEEDGIFEAGMAAADSGKDQLLVQILRRFPSSQCVEGFLSVCRKAVARATDSTGLYLHKVRRSALHVYTDSLNNYHCEHVLVQSGRYDEGII